MKKILLCMVLAGLMMPVVAQEKMKVSDKQMQKFVRTKVSDLEIPTNNSLPVNPTRFIVEADGWTIAGQAEGYDLQTQGGVYPMAMLHSDKSFMGTVWTNNMAPPFSGNPDPNNRCIGYNYSTDGGKTWAEQENRIGGLPLYWGSYAQWGPNGEAIMGRSMYDHVFQGIQIKDGLVLLTRKTRGTGDWTITPVPYPADANPAYFMAWGSMTTSGENNEYIHIVTPMSTRDVPTIPYHDYSEPLLYFRTTNGETFDIDGVVVPEMLGIEDWGPEANYSDGMSFSVKGNTIACSFISIGSHGYVMRSLDNGDNWETIKFFDSPILGHLTTSDYADSVYVPSVGCVALDNNNKIHVVFSMICATNDDKPGSFGYWPYAWAQFLSYWNEDMPTMEGEKDFTIREMAPKLMWMWWEDVPSDDTYFDWDLSIDNNLYVKSIVPKWPIIGYFIPLINPPYYTFIEDNQQWAGSSYRQAGMFSFPQMAFDINNTLHLVYLGLLDGAADDSRWLRHPFYTTRDSFGNWTETDYFVNDLDYVNKEFAYPLLAGVGNDKMYFQFMIDDMAGLFIPPGQGAPSDHNSTTNYFTHINLIPFPTTSIIEIEKTSLSMIVHPNPALGKVTVRFDGKGDITIFNILGQTVYHVENVVKEKEISLNNLTTGVYFVNVRSGNATATQKLIVK